MLSKHSLNSRLHLTRKVGNYKDVLFNSENVALFWDNINNIGIKLCTSCIKGYGFAMTLERPKMAIKWLKDTIHFEG